MGKPKLIFATLIPRDPNLRNELKCIERMLEGWKDIEGSYESMRAIIGSAHTGALEEAKDKLAKYKYSPDIEFIHCPFKWDDRMSEERAHEIGYCKRFIHQHIMDMCYEHILFWIDSDMYIPLSNVNRWREKMTHSSFFVTLPYCVRHGLAAPPVQFGAYLMNTAKLTPDSLKTMYQTEVKEDTICRIGAPDCRFKDALLAAGNKNLYAMDIYSEHYSDVEEGQEKRYVYMYEKGHLFREEW